MLEALRASEEHIMTQINEQLHASEERIMTKINEQLRVSEERIMNKINQQYIFHHFIYDQNLIYLGPPSSLSAFTIQDARMMPHSDTLLSLMPSIFHKTKLSCIK